MEGSPRPISERGELEGCITARRDENHMIRMYSTAHFIDSHAERIYVCRGSERFSAQALGAHPIWTPNLRQAGALHHVFLNLG